MEKNKKRIIFLLVIILILLLTFLWWILRTSDLGPGSEENPENNQPEFNAPSANLEYQPVAVAPETDTEFGVVNLAKTYAARFGSWSTDNLKHNLEELIPLSTPAMRSYLQSIEADYSQTEFSGITTKALSADILSISDDSATVMVSTQRIETKADLSSQVYYQDIRIEMRQISGQWLVSRVDWQ